MHIIKLKAAEIKTVLKEATREHKSKVGTIDETRTAQNYNLAPVENKIHEAEKLKERIKELGVKRKIKDDAVLVCSCIIDKPKDCDVSNEDFFKSAYKALIKELCDGKEELVIQAEVHMDEKTPHMHFSFIPIVEKEGKIKLSAKEKLTKAFLREFHPNVEKSMQEELKAPVCLYNEEKCREREEKRNRGDFSAEYVSLEEYKATKEKETYLETIKAETKQVEAIYDDKWQGIGLLEEETEEKRKEKAEIDAEIEKGNEVLGKMVQRFDTLKAENSKIKAENEELSKEVGALQATIDALKKQKRAIYDGLKAFAKELADGVKKLEKTLFWIRDKKPEIAKEYEEKGNKLYNKGLSELGNLNYTKAKETVKELYELAEEAEELER